MAITARNQITIVDLNDAKSVQVYFTASQGFSQGYNPDTNVYTPITLHRTTRLLRKCMRVAMQRSIWRTV
ncbi:hypothetical protein ABVC73_12730 [Prevotella melaninogenica]